MSQDILSDGLNQIINAKKARKKSVTLKKHSKLLRNVLDIAKADGYIDYSVNGTELTVEIKKLNEFKAIKPRFYVAIKDIDKYIRRFLPAKDFGIIILSTNQGLLTHTEAIEKNTGGSLIAYCF